MDKCGARLFVPDGVVEKGEELFSIEVTDEEWNKPNLQEGKIKLVFIKADLDSKY